MAETWDPKLLLPATRHLRQPPATREWMQLGQHAVLPLPDASYLTANRLPLTAKT
jgi:hypothetical protein